MFPKTLYECRFPMKFRSWLMIINEYEYEFQFRVSG